MTVRCVSACVTTSWNQPESDQGNSTAPLAQGQTQRLVIGRLWVPFLWSGCKSATKTLLFRVVMSCFQEWRDPVFCFYLIFFKKWADPENVFSLDDPILSRIAKSSQRTEKLKHIRCLTHTLDLLTRSILFSFTLTLVPQHLISD